MGGSVLTGSHPNNPSLPREVAPQMPHRRPQPPRIEHGGGAAALVHAVEALGVLYGDVQLLSQLLEGLVGREVQAVEALQTHTHRGKREETVTGKKKRGIQIVHYKVYKFKK